jgi:hypothetical protein
MGLLWDDVLLILRSLRYIPNILLPLRPLRRSNREEFRITCENSGILVVHITLIIIQLGFLVSLLFCFVLPIVTFVVYLAGVILVNFTICGYLNGRDILVSRTSILTSATQDEYWVFINGVAAG